MNVPKWEYRLMAEHVACHWASRLMQCFLHFTSVMGPFGRLPVFRQGMTLTALGVAIRLSGAAAASGALITSLFGILRLDPITYLGVIALVMGVSGVACRVPARRAAQVDPAITLRAE